MKEKMGLYRPLLYVLMGLCAAMVIATFFVNIRLFYVELAVVVVAFIFIAVRVIGIQKDIHLYLQQLGHTLTTAQKSSLVEFPVPVMVSMQGNEIAWYNNVFRDKVAKGKDMIGLAVTDVVKDPDNPKLSTDDGVYLNVDGRSYRVFRSQSEEDGHKLNMYYFVDQTTLINIAKEYELTRPSVLLIVIDNYEELLQNAKDSEKVQVISEIERAIENFVGDTAGLLRKLEKDKFVAVVEERYMRRIIDSKFDILDKVRSIVAGDRMPATLSIGIGRDGASLSEAENMAKQALDMALGRGGDQAAVKTQKGFEFYGGVSKGIEKRTKVKTRIVASALSELIENSDNVIIMGHQFSDLDCVGASIGLCRVVRNMGKHAVVAIQRSKSLAAPLVERMIEKGSGDMFAEPMTLLPNVTRKTLLIVVDTHIQHFLESRELYAACKSVVVIDHHRKMVDHIDNAVIFYHEPYSSSASEMVAELIQYLGDQNGIGRLEAEALLSGIMLDTKNFVMKTGVRTFEAAAYLKRLGADTVEVRKLFSDSMEAYQKKSRVVAGAEIYRNCAIACIGGTYDEDMRIVAPQAADELLGINDVIASFVAYETDKGISFSARSMGGMNVQLVMERLGGGGHLTMAGAQINATSMEDARQMLLEAIDAYFTSAPTLP
ncbi:DHH family phosphoesterase [Zongyangia hominis]|uniref:Cyclic-di-AMP phosphodiesterase n=1 Tax=Zongyangia hominis TaxID=2763677 RepID=A0A926ED84_9FIRM|nr:DHH family phosphoesterase [Zongyangia hominis]MBC8570069.1 DHH family phosphoesterase [Zongyangia hominis]